MQLARMLRRRDERAHGAEQAARDAARAAHRARGRQAHDPRAVDEPRVLRQRRVRPRGRGAAVLRQAGRARCRPARRRCSRCCRARRPRTIRSRHLDAALAPPRSRARSARRARRDRRPAPRATRAPSSSRSRVTRRRTPRRTSREWVLAQLPADVRRAGGTVHTTLDLRLQQLLERRVAEQVAALAHDEPRSRPASSCSTPRPPRCARWSARRAGADSGSSTSTTRRRHPGSALKPFVYATAIERGASPATIAWDVARHRATTTSRRRAASSTARCATARRSRARTTSPRSTCSSRSASRA